MSEDDPSNSDSGSGSGSDPDSEDLETTGLIATRAKRSNAGGLYSRLRAHLDDEEFQRELLGDEPEDENDFGDYEGGDGEEDDDAALDSSSDDDDTGPPKEGDAEEWSGEKEVKKAERAEARKKRKAKDVRLVVPAWQKKKKVKLADDVKTEDGASDRPKKKSERSNWLPTPADMPTRQSDRSLARANREITHAHLKQSAERSEKQRKVMKNAAEREKAHKREDLTKEQRLAMALKIETQTKKEFGLWERDEKERQRIRDEQLAAKRRRVIYGPIMRFWSGSAIWQGDVLREKRVLPDTYQAPEDVEMADEPAPDVAASTKPDSNMLPAAPTGTQTPSGVSVDKEPGAEGEVPKTSDVITEVPESALTNLNTEPQNAVSSAEPSQPVPVSKTPIPAMDLSNVAAVEAPTSTVPMNATTDTTITTPAETTNALTQPETESTTKPETTLLRGIHEYAEAPPDQPPPTTDVSPPAQPSKFVFYMPSAPILHAPLINHSHTAILPPRPPSPPPLPRERAQRCLVMLDQFEDLDTAMAPKKLPKNASILEPRELATILIPESYPAFTPDEAKYLTAKMKKRGIDPPPKLRCALTSWPAKFRDPKTGLAYADLQTYKIIQRVLAGGCAWSSVLGTWVGPAYGAMGRPAKGVPPGFAGPVVELGTGPVVKSESGK